jgi:carbon storage regulator CsrA
MLVLSRKVGESFVIGDKITVTVVRIAGGGVRLGIEAPRDYVVIRQELGAPVGPASVSVSPTGLIDEQQPS